MSIQDSIISVGIGLFTGFASGLMGIGGGALGTPLIKLLLNTPAVVALATTMPVMFPSAVSGVINYVRARKVDVSLALGLLVTAIPMTWVGAIVTQYVTGTALMIFTALFLIIIGASFLLRQLIMKEEAPEGERPNIVWWQVGLAGVIGGFLAGLLAVGGGVIYVPAILRIFKRPMKVALATSLIVVTAVSIPGTIKHAMLGHIDWTIAGMISIGVIPAAFFGAKAALKLRNQTLERIFGTLTIIFGLYFLFSQI
jgi:uncharacterized membrane protein YfcA